MIRHGPITPRGRNDGFIIVPVLWILLTLAGLAGILSVYLANTAATLSLNDDRLRSAALVSASLELTAYKLSAAAKALRPPAGSFAFRLNHARVSVAFQSEASRIDLNHASKAMLSNLFQLLGARGRDASHYADRIIAWRTPPSGDAPEAESSLDRAAGIGHQPRGALFGHVDELWMVLDLPPALVERAMPFVTVFSGRREIEPFDAAPEVVASLPEMTPELLKAFLDQRASLPRNANSLIAALGPARGGATAEAGDAVRVHTTIAFDNGRQTATEAVILLDTGDEPYRVLSWRDDTETTPVRGPKRRTP
jgi:general secretion pathway protein K